MKTIFAALVTLMVLVCAPCSWAQPPSGPAGGFVGRGFVPFGADKLMLLAQKSVQEALKLTDKQTTQVEQRLVKQREGFEKLRELEVADVEKRLTKQVKTNDVLLGKLLTADQFRRLSEISLQRRGARALGDAEVAKSLGLTGGQKTKIKTIIDESQDQMRAQFSQLGGPGSPAGFPVRGPLGQRPPGAPPGGNLATSGPGDAGGGPAEAARDGAIATRRAQRSSGAPHSGGPPGGTPEQQAAREQFFKQADELRKATDAKLLGVLTDDQKSKWHTMQGESFKGQFAPPGRRGERPGGGEPDANQGGQDR